MVESTSESHIQIRPLLSASNAPKSKQSNKRKLKRHRCPEPNCEYEATCLRDYGMHAQKTHGIKPFNCPDCGTRSARKDNLSASAHAKICKAKQEKAKKTSPERPRRPEKIAERARKRVRLSETSSETTKAPITASPNSNSTPGFDDSNRLVLIPQSEIFCQNIPGTSDDAALLVELKAKLAACEEENKRLKEKDAKVRAKLKNMETDLREAWQDRDFWYERYKLCESRKRRNSSSENEDEDDVL
ncbi:hypothetical protein TWF481_003721 [Arthrobotrys musiformis]|uniref:C2H2-type domain-containing protein n=1 Tax=Arthrobotrys musiformis TaxID=47236 RepID=A0AAV9WHG6_9PEZI